MKKTLWMVLVVALVQACSNAPKDLKSPCAGLEDSPCGPRHPVNNGWMHG